MSGKNLQILLASRPAGEPTLDNFDTRESDIPTSQPDRMLLRAIYLSLDPYLRGRMNAGKSYAKPVEIGEVMEGRTIAEVVSSELAGYIAGDIVFNPNHGWQIFASSDGKGVHKVDPSVKPPSYALGVLGMPGLTAYTGLGNIGCPQAGETLVVAAASGAVGSVVGSRNVVLSASLAGQQSAIMSKGELGFDECLDRREPNLAERLQAACPKGIDVYFENVGGQVFQAVLPLLNDFARIPVCGLISHYNATEPDQGPDRLPRMMQQILTKRLTLRGFIVGDFASQLTQFLSDMGQWIGEGRIKYKEDITDGLENAPRELIGLLRGDNFGKKIIRVSQDPSLVA